MNQSGHSPCILVKSAFNMGLLLLSDWHKKQPDSSIRFVQLSSAEVSQLADLARTLQQYPRVQFVVYCDCMSASEGSAEHGALQSVIEGNRQQVMCCCFDVLLS